MPYSACSVRHSWVYSSRGTGANRCTLQRSTEFNAARIFGFSGATGFTLAFEQNDMSQVLLAFTEVE